jgi:hypothetical protein
VDIRNEVAVQDGWMLPRQWREEFEDPTLASEFRSQPLGPHSARLGRLLLIMKAAPLPGRPVIIRRSDGRYDVAELPSFPGEALEVRGGPFSSDERGAAEQLAFALRWQALFGTEVPW